MSAWSRDDRRGMNEFFIVGSVPASLGPVPAPLQVQVARHWANHRMPLVRIYLSNLGCKLNQAEIEAFGRQFAARGHRVVSSLQDADVHVINTCTVTHIADRSSRKLARRGSRVKPGLRTVLTGCYATSNAPEAVGLTGVDLVVPNPEKDSLVDRVEDAFPEYASTTLQEHFPYGDSALAAGRARAAVKIEDGCNMRCSFCIIPFTRGAQISRAPEEIAREIDRLVAGGLREIVLTGVQISSYRWRELRLVDLVHHLLTVTGPARLRLTSIAPWAFDNRLLDLLANASICPHIHLSLQAGCDRTLQRMKRPYSVADYETLVESIRANQPDTALTTDVIVGFPGESDRHFARSLATVERIGFAKIHVFPYSPREGTEAADLDEQVPVALRRERMQEMLRVASESEARFQLPHVGRRRQVLWEGAANGTGGTEVVGTTDNYLRVRGANAPDRVDGSLKTEKLSRGADGELWAA